MHTLFISLIVYMVVMFFVVYTKPGNMYNHETRTYKSFGTDRESTLFPFWMCAVVSALASYVTVSTVSQICVANDSNTHTTTEHSHPPISSLENVLPSPMRRATIGGNRMMPHHSTQPTFAATHTPYHYHMRQHHIPNAHTYHSPNTHDHTQGMSVQQSRVWKNGMD